jgi:hypothetical protein
MERLSVRERRGRGEWPFEAGMSSIGEDGGYSMGRRRRQGAEGHGYFAWTVCEGGNIGKRMSSTRRLLRRLPDRFPPRRGNLRDE